MGVVRHSMMCTHGRWTLNYDYRIRTLSWETFLFLAAQTQAPRSDRPEGRISMYIRRSNLKYKCIKTELQKLQNRFSDFTNYFML